MRYTGKGWYRGFMIIGICLMLKSSICFSQKLVGKLDRSGDTLTISNDRVDAFEDGDARRGVTIDTIASTVDALIYKYGADPAGLGESDWPVIRYSDVLLMLAEALNEQGYVANGEAFDLLNRVRTRAGLAALTSETIPDQESFRLAIEQERRVELASEGHRWFDLVRTGGYVSVMSAKGFNVQTFHEVFPIPANELLKINDPAILDQNTGY